MTGISATALVTRKAVLTATNATVPDLDGYRHHTVWSISEALPKPTRKG